MGRMSRLDHGSAIQPCSHIECLVETARRGLERLEVGIRLFFRVRVASPMVAVRCCSKAATRLLVAPGIQNTGALDGRDWRISVAMGDLSGGPPQLWAGKEMARGGGAIRWFYFSGSTRVG